MVSASPLGTVSSGSSVPSVASLPFELVSSNLSNTSIAWSWVKFGFPHVVRRPQPLTVALFLKARLERERV